MSIVNWDKFVGLPGSQEANFERLCRTVIRRHYGKHGSFRELANQAGVEFHLKLHSACDLGNANRWYGWQCKWYALKTGQALGTNRKNKIVDGIEKTRTHLPGVTDWVLWTRYTLCKADQEWYYGLETRFPQLKFQLKTGADLEALLHGPALPLRETYFGDLIVDLECLSQQQELAAAPYVDKFKSEVHLVTAVEDDIFKQLGDQRAWKAFEQIATSMENAIGHLTVFIAGPPAGLEDAVNTLADAVKNLVGHLDLVFEALENVDMDALHQLLSMPLSSPHTHRRLLSDLRKVRSPHVLACTNLVADVYAAYRALADLRESMGDRVLAVLAAAGNGKSELATSITRADGVRPAGVLFLGNELGSGQNLDHLARNFKISGKPVETFERLVEALEAAGQRLGRRIPIVIDGLNEAEDHLDWFAVISRAQTVLKQYQYVLLIVTLRDEFAEDCLPEGVSQFELDGFGNNTEGAIEKYFSYYKIDAGDADLPMDQLQHPLTLKIYCEVANRERAVVVGAEKLPRSLTALFEEHIAQTAKRIYKLSSAKERIRPEEVEDALVCIGRMLWEGNARSIDTQKVRIEIKDIVQWNASLLRALESEGILLRASHGRRRAGVGFAYDLMAGHLIARHLLESEDLEQWFADPENVARFYPRSAKSHTLAYDIFSALVGLYPTFNHSQPLWKIAPPSLVNNALLLTSKSDPKYISQETAQKFKDAMWTTKTFAKSAFHNLRFTRAAENHPYDAKFLDSVLRTFKNAERDELWTEWVREQDESLILDLKELLLKWERGAITSVDVNRARWVMWLLTSTSRYLRDLATKVLVVFAGSRFADFIELLAASLTISDPYVPERVLAACYGAALLGWSDKTSAVRTELPALAKFLLDQCFRPGAPNSSRHVVLRYYALGTISLALRVDSACLSVSDRKFLEPPFAHLPSSPFDIGFAWSNEQVKEADDAAIHMDFGNYTIGKLVDDRSNYDFKHAEYVDVRRSIVKRMLDLGYSPELFTTLDKNTYSSNRIANEGRKVDRYGKKYSWIAFYEMWGLRADFGRLAGWRTEHKISEVDIDPSFPMIEPTWRPELGDCFSAQPMDIASWMENGPTPNYSNMLRVSEVDSVMGDWVLLDGFIKQQSVTDYREIFTFLRGVIVDKNDTKALIRGFKSIDYPGNSCIPSAKERHYTYAGEMVFEMEPGDPKSFETCDEFLDQEVQKDQEDQQAYFSPGWGKPGTPVEIPSQMYSWESYHSEMNKAGGILFPSPSICEQLELSYNNSHSSLLVDTDGNPAVISRRIGANDESASGTLLYLRADLLSKYLKILNQDLAWLVWGERGQNYNAGEEKQGVPQHIYDDYLYIHKQSKIWSESWKPRSVKKKRLAK